MTKFTERMPATSDAIMRRLESLEREVQQLRAARRLEAATIGAGGITVDGGRVVVRDSYGKTIAILGRLDDLLPDPNGKKQPGFRLLRSDGSLALTLDDPLPSVDGYRQILRVYDRSNREILAEDATSGWGLAGPTGQQPLYPSDYTDFPSRDDTTFGSILQGVFTAWNPFVEVSVLSTMAVSGATGQIRLMVNGTQVGTTASVGFAVSQTSWTVPVATYSADPKDTFQVSVEGRRASGSGRIHVAPYYAMGDRS